MTFQDYIDNPMGKKNAVFSGREMYKAMYTQKFGEVNLREAGKLTYQLFYVDRTDEFYCYMKIPSESVTNFYYDVVVRFRTEDDALRTVGTLDKYNVEFFSNDPAFVYTYLRVFELGNMFIDSLKTKAPKLSLKQDPVVRNAYMTPGYVKSLYFAFLYMKGRGLFMKAAYRDYGKPFNRSLLLSQIPSFEEKMEDRKEKEAAMKKAKAKGREVKSDLAKKTVKDPLDPSAKNITTTRKTKRVGFSNASKRTPTTPTANLIKRSKTVPRG